MEIIDDTSKKDKNTNTTAGSVIAMASGCLMRKCGVATIALHHQACKGHSTIVSRSCTSPWTCASSTTSTMAGKRENYQSATMELAVKSSFHKVMLWPRARSMIPQVKKPIWSMQNESVHDNPHANYQYSFITNKYYDVSHTGDQKSSTWEIEIYTASSGCTTCNVCGCMYCCVLNAGVDVK